MIRFNKIKAKAKRAHGWSPGYFWLMGWKRGSQKESLRSIYIRRQQFMATASKQVLTRPLSDISQAQRLIGLPTCSHWEVSITLPLWTSLATLSLIFALFIIQVLYFVSHQRLHHAQTGPWVQILIEWRKQGRHLWQIYFLLRILFLNILYIKSLIESQAIQLQRRREKDNIK